MEKEKIITDLLGIRGGLSIISKYSDEIKKENELIDEKKKEKSSIEYDLEKIQSAIEKCKGIDERIQSLKHSLRPDVLEKEAQEYAREHVPLGVGESAGKHKIIVLVGQSLLFALLAPVLMYIGWLIDVLFLDKDSLSYCAIIGASIGLFAFPLCSLIRYPFEIKNQIVRTKKRNEERYNRDLKYDIDKLRSTANSELDGWHRVDHDEINDINDLYSLEANCKKRLQQKEIELENVEKTASVSIRYATEKAEAMVMAMRNTYGAVINESDWGNVDLIIHYFETQRADTLKEALQQVDKQKQTDQIVKAIRVASESISLHIESAFSRMGQALAMSFNRLNDNLNEIAGQLEKNEKSIIASNQELVGRLDKQISISEVQNALLEKSNKTSDELLFDLRYNQKYWLK